MLPTVLMCRLGIIARLVGICIYITFYQRHIDQNDCQICDQHNRITYMYICKICYLEIFRKIFRYLLNSISAHEFSIPILEREYS